MSDSEKYCFSGEELVPIKELATRRRQYAIDNRSKGKAKEQAERENLIENHMAGVAAERAVERWLRKHGLSPECNFEDPATDFSGAADIVVGATRCDVKSSAGYCYPECQRGSLKRKDVVIWCWARADNVFSGGGMIPRYAVDINGWSETDDIEQLTPDVEDDNVVLKKDVRKLPGLLTKLGVDAMASPAASTEDKKPTG